MIEDYILELVKSANPSNPTQFVRSIVKEYSVDKIAKQIQICNDCKICDANIKTIPHGNPNATIMIIGGAPEPSESSEGLHNSLFDKKSSDILNFVLYDRLRLNCDELFFANTINCFPHKTSNDKIIHRTPTTSELTSCITFLKALIDIVQPLVIILLGATALNAFEPSHNISKVRGEWLKVNGIPAIATYDPEYFIKIDGKKSEDLINIQQQEFIDDIEKAVEFIRRKYPKIQIVEGIHNEEKR